VIVYCLIKYYVLYLTFGLADESIELIVVKKEELKLYVLVFDKLDIVLP